MGNQMNWITSWFFLFCGLFLFNACDNGCNTWELLIFAALP